MIVINSARDNDNTGPSNNTFLSHQIHDCHKHGGRYSIGPSHNMKKILQLIIHIIVINLAGGDDRSDFYATAAEQASFLSLAANVALHDFVFHLVPDEAVCMFSRVCYSGGKGSLLYVYGCCVCT